MQRRRFLQIGFSGLGAAAIRPLLALGAASVSDGFCLFLGNHWSYIGIGWQLGIESCALSVLDSIEIADRKPGVKTCINLDARAYEYLAEKFPPLTERLKKYLADGKVELIGGTFSQPMGTLYSGESNIRQIVVGRETIRKALGYEMETFLEEEEFAHPQLPQILTGAGYKYTSLSQMDTWAYAGSPVLPLNVFHWKGMDGSTVLCAAKNGLYLGAADSGDSPLPYLFAPETEVALRKLQALGKPLVQYWAELGWESPDNPEYLHLPQRFEGASGKLNIEYITMGEYLRKYGSQAQETIYLNMDAWKKLLPWGIGGDQVRVNARKIEAILHAAERADAVGGLAGSKSVQRRREQLEGAWRNLLTAQSHDVNLCEYSRWQGDRMAPMNLIEDHHDQTWGSIGYHHLDEAETAGTRVLEDSLSEIADRVAQPQGADGPSIVVFNACSWERTDLARTGKIYFKNRQGRHVSVVNSAGEPVPFQVESMERDAAGNLVAVDISFLATNVPSVGYDTYAVKFSAEPAPASKANLLLDAGKLQLENEFVRLQLDPKHGALASLIDKTTGREFLDASKCATPTFRGQPNLKYLFLEKDPDSAYDSSQKDAQLAWIEKGPLRATLKAVRSWKQLTFETRVSLYAHSPGVEVVSRVLTQVPPATDPLAPEGPHDWARAERNIRNGYWLVFSPAFAASAVRRDFPLGVEETTHDRVHGLTFVDLVGAEQGLLVVHSGSQYFRREADGTWSNLVMREWESEFSHEYGFPNYAEYRHILIAHGPTMSDAQRVRVATECDQTLRTGVSWARSGQLAAKKSFVRLSSDNVLVSAFRRQAEDDYELRLLETSGKSVKVDVEIGVPISRGNEVDLLGRTAGPILGGSKFGLAISPWQFLTLRLNGATD